MPLLTITSKWLNFYSSQTDISRLLKLGLITSHSLKNNVIYLLSAPIAQISRVQRTSYNLFGLRECKFPGITDCTLPELHPHLHSKLSLKKNVIYINKLTNWFHKLKYLLCINIISAYIQNKNPRQDDEDKNYSEHPKCKEFKVLNTLCPNEIINIDQ